MGGKRQLTHEEFMEKVITNNEYVRRGDIEIRGKYVNSKTPVKCYCTKHDMEWSPIPSSLYYGYGCRLCAIERASQRYMMSHEDFLKKLYEVNDGFRRGDFKVVGTYNGSSKPVQCYCNIHDHLWEPIPSNLYKGYGCPICGQAKSRLSQRISHDEFMARVLDVNEHVRNGNLEIRGKYEGTDTPIECYCTIHNVTTFPTPYSLQHGSGCPYCAGTKVLKGFNDLWTTDPKVAELLTNPEDGYTIARMSHKKLNFTCPFCGKKQDKFVLNVTRRGLQCDNCSDHISFPNRFGRAFLDQLPIDDYTPEYSPDWLKPYSLDLFFEYNGKALALEMDGGVGHGNKQWGPGNKKDIEGKERDILKDKLAAENGIEVIRIDAQESSSEYIGKHILQSKLNQIFDLSVIDWIKCDMDAQKNLVKEVCDLYMSGIKKLQDIADILKISDQSVRNYLKRGVKFGWCDYSPRVAQLNRNIPPQGRKIIVTNIDTEQQFEFKNIKHCASNILDVCGITVSHNTIRKYCNNKQPYKGFDFRFMDETIQD